MRPLRVRPWLAIVATLAIVLVGAGTASAQTSYPPTTGSIPRPTTPVIPSSGGTIDPTKTKPLPLPPAPQQDGQMTDDDRFLPREVIVELPQGSPQPLVVQIGQTYNLQIIEVFPSPLIARDIVRYRIPDARSATALLTILQADPRILAAQPNALYDLSAPAQQYAFERLNMPEAAIGKGGKGLRIAVIDTGIDTSHPVLAGAAIETVSVLEKGGRRSEHGTAIGSLLVARGQMVGIAPDATMIGIEAFGGAADARSATHLMVKSLTVAAERKARIVNMSLEGPYDDLLKRNLDSLFNRNVVLIAAAGNGGPNAKPAYPAAYQSVLAITATDKSDRLYSNANRGGYVFAAAPGVNIFGAAPGGKFKLSSGTSMAAAFASGFAALLLERQPKLSTVQIAELMAQTAADLGPDGPDEQFGAGRLDATAALARLGAVASK